MRIRKRKSKRICESIKFNKYDTVYQVGELPIVSVVSVGASSQSQDEVDGALLLDVVVADCPAVLESLAGKNESLLVGWDPFLVVDLGFDVFNGVAAFDIDRHGLSCECSYEYLHVAFLFN